LNPNERAYLPKFWTNNDQELVNDFYKVEFSQRQYRDCTGDWIS
jgi:hypothetical protein